MLNWQEVAINDLRNHKKRKQSLDNIKTKIKALSEQYEAVRCSSRSDKIPVTGGACRIEDSMLSNIVERKRLEHTYKAVKHLVCLVDCGLKVLNAKEYNVLCDFYIDRPKNHIDKLMQEFGVDKSQIYRIKDLALYNFTISMYGIVDY